MTLETKTTRYDSRSHALSIIMLKILMINFHILVNGILLQPGYNGHNNINLMYGINPIILLVGEDRLLALHNFLCNNNNLNNFHLPNLCINSNYNFHLIHHQDLLSLPNLIQTQATKHFSLLMHLIWQVKPPTVFLSRSVMRYIFGLTECWIKGLIQLSLNKKKRRFNHLKWFCT